MIWWTITCPVLILWPNKYESAQDQLPESSASSCTSLSHWKIVEKQQNKIKSEKERLGLMCAEWQCPYDQCNSPITTTPILFARHFYIGFSICVSPLWKSTLFFPSLSLHAVKTVICRMDGAAKHDSVAGHKQKQKIKARLTFNFSRTTWHQREIVTPRLNLI